MKALAQRVAIVTGASPTNAALHNGKLYLANVGERFISVLDTDLQPGPVSRPKF